MSKIKRLDLKIAKSDSMPTGHVTVEWAGTMVMGMGEGWEGWEGWWCVPEWVHTLGVAAG